MFRKQLLIAPVALVAALAFGGCGSDSTPVQGKTEATRAAVLSGGDVLISYRGRTIHCIPQWEGTNTLASCDFQRFYKENPDFLTDN